MAVMGFSLLPVLLVLLRLSVQFQSVDCRIYSFEMHHRFSEPVKKWSEKAGNSFLAVENWPVKGSVEYYAALADTDRVLRGRRLLDSENSLTFSDGNSTFRISALGFLHYTTVMLGTPGMKFLVALDTGSDLFWVPCDCSQCASTESTTYASDFEFGIYSLEGSSTSKKVSCNHSLCSHHDQCNSAFSSCPYMVSYVSAETSTSGVLVEDLLHLTTEDSDEETTEVYITFGCGQVQTGSFLDVAAPNGLLGLGMEDISVPSILSNEGFTADSFSMCFGKDGVGRISFGDKGSTDQEETPFIVNPSQPAYNVNVTELRVGTTLIDVDFTALFDSGTSFTYLVNPGYSRLTDSFNSQVSDKRCPPDSKIPFEYCYDMSPGENTSFIPNISINMEGGGHYAVYDPIIVISGQDGVIFCLAIVESTYLNIIGQNFMTGYRVVFDRERLILGWKKFNCYDIDNTTKIPVEPLATSLPPAVAAGLRNHSSSTSQSVTWKDPKSSFASPSCCRTTCFLLISQLLVIVTFLLYVRKLAFCLLVLTFVGQSCDGFGTFGFDVHHRFSDPVKGVLAVDDLPEEGSVEYSAFLSHRDHIIHGRRLSSTVDQSRLTFFYGNKTYRISAFGHLHYTYVSVGTPNVTFLVALDTGSDLFWLPCDCNSCVHTLVLPSGARVDLNIYSPEASSTSATVPCNGALCRLKRQCSSAHNICPFEVAYLSNNTSSSGILVQDVLHLVTDDDQSQAVDAQIMFGCGQVLTGSFLDGAAFNGLFGLGIDDRAVPSILAKEGIIANSFSMCFGFQGLGRITFGDKGSLDQGQTSFNLQQRRPTYNVSITQVRVGDKVTDVSFSAIFDSGTSYTYLNDPAYKTISESIRYKRLPVDSDIPFENCYDLSSKQNFSSPPFNLIMRGGDHYNVTSPVVALQSGTGYIYCLGVVKSEDVNIIGQNFMTGYRIVFDREKMVLGWKASNCYNTESKTLVIGPTAGSPSSITVSPEATGRLNNESSTAQASMPMASESRRLHHFTLAYLIIFFYLLTFI